MLSREEWRWLPWSPLLLVQGLYARLATARLAPAAGPCGRTGPGRSIRLVGVGDSIIAGIGVARHTAGLVGQVSRLVASGAGMAVEWNAVGESGADSETVLRHLVPRAVDFSPQLVVLSVGVNDAVAGVPRAAFKARLSSIVDALSESAARPAIVFAGIPPLEVFPALPWPLSRVLGARARALQAAAVELTGRRGLRVVNFPARIDPAGFAADGFHPGESGCAAWARWVADGLAPALERMG